MGVVAWPNVFDAKTYRLMITRVAVWSSYATSDPTAFVVLTDTLNDILLDTLHKHDSAIGAYTLGHIGAALQPTSQFARKYPRLYRIADQVHKMRLSADLAHPVTRSTNAPTRRIPYRDMKKLFKPLQAGYLELWQLW